MDPNAKHAENDAACVPPCSLACRVTGGRHHTAGSVRAAALAELANDAPVIERVDRYRVRLAVPMMPRYEGGTCESACLTGHVDRDCTIHAGYSPA